MKYSGHTGKKGFCKIRSLAGVLSAFLLAAVLYGALVEPGRVRLKEVTVYNDALAGVLENRTVAHLSDLHFGRGWSRANREALRIVESIKPDLIVLTGDYVQWGSGSAAYENAFSFLSRLEAELGVFAVTGDADLTFSRKYCEFCHDGQDGSTTARLGVTFLKDSRATIRIGGDALIVAGRDVESKFIPSESVEDLRGSDLPELLLSHSSVSFEGIDRTRNLLMLSGDTHGGQVRLPRWLWRVTGRKPDPDHMYGLYRDGNKSLYVNGGIGTSPPHFRFGSPPEVAVITFKKTGGT